MIADLEAWLLGMLQTLFDLWGWWGVGAMMAFENATSLTPSEITLGLAGWLLLSAREAPFPLVFLGALYAAIGSLAGASLTYWAARLGGRPLVDRGARWLRIDLRYITAAETQFRRHGVKLVLFGRLLPTVRTAVTIPAGLARMPYVQFAALTFTGAYLWCALLISAGYVLGVEWMLFREVILEQAGKYAPVGIVFLVALAAGWFLVREVWYRRRGKPAPVLIQIEDMRSNGDPHE